MVNAAREIPRSIQRYGIMHLERMTGSTSFAPEFSISTSEMGEL